MDMQPTIDLADEVARAADAATEPERARRLDGAPTPAPAIPPKRRGRPPKPPELRKPRVYLPRPGDRSLPATPEQQAEREALIARAAAVVEGRHPKMPIKGVTLQMIVLEAAGDGVKLKYSSLCRRQRHASTALGELRAWVEAGELSATPAETK